VLRWSAREPTPGDRREWLIARGDPDPHPLFASYPGRRLHKVALTDLEEHWALDQAIVGSGLRLVETVADDGAGGHAWFEEVPGWSEELRRPDPPPPAPKPRRRHA
jgi:hypothetical protein